MKLSILVPTLLFSFSAGAKTFQNSYVSFEVPDSWTCAQEGVAWTCMPISAVQSKEAVIVLASKVAGPSDTLGNFKSFLSQPKSIASKVGAPMPSKVMYSQERILAGTSWVQAQHLSSEIQDYYTLYLATVKDQLAILVSFSAEKDKYQTYNPVFDKAMKTLKIVANQQLLFPNKKGQGSSSSDTIGIAPVAPPSIDPANLLPPPEKKGGGGFGFVHFILVLAVVGTGLGLYLSRAGKKPGNRPKNKPRSR